jgi:hypothetical protein
MPPPVQVPSRQVAPAAHGLVVLQAVPFVAGGFEQSPVLGLQVPGTWHSSSALQVTAVPRQLPAWHASSVVQRTSSLQRVPSALTGFEQAPVAGSQVPAR